MRIDILTLFPEMCDFVLDTSITGRAKKAGHVEIYTHNIRDYSDNKHKKTDDYPYGGGRGMIMTPEPIYKCFMSVCEQVKSKPHLIYMSPNRASRENTI